MNRMSGIHSVDQIEKTLEEVKQKGLKQVPRQDWMMMMSINTTHECVQMNSSTSVFLFLLFQSISLYIHLQPHYSVSFKISHVFRSQFAWLEFSSITQVLLYGNVTVPKWIWIYWSFRVCLKWMAIFWIKYSE